MDQPGLLHLHTEEIFHCRTCHGRDGFALMNPYLDRNAKNDPAAAVDFPAHRRSFLRAYVESLEGTRPTVMIVGEAPGLDGCGYCGIAFTGEHNAIFDRELPDYHRSGPPYQHEDSATLVYAAMRQAAAQLGVEFAAVARRVFQTNTCLCVPLKPNLTSIRPPDSSMKANCLNFLRRQIDLVEPAAIIALGGKAWKAVCDLYDVRAQGVGNRSQRPALCESVEHERTYPVDERLLIPEIHPSDQANLNARSRALRPGLQERLAAHMTRALVEVQR